MRDDGQEIGDAIAARIEDVLSDLAPGWARRGQKAYLTPKGPKDLGSFTVNVAGPHRGTWFRFSQRIGGGPLKLVAYLLNGNVEPTKDDYRAAFDWAKRFLGIGQSVEAEADRAARKEREEAQRRQRQQDRQREAAKEREVKKRRAATAAGIWAECVPIAGTRAEAYLVARGIPPVSDWPWGPDGTLGFHPELDHQDGAAWPALVARVDNPFGEMVAIWRIYLDRERAKKAPVDNAKMGLGPAMGGAVRIGGIASYIGIAEGLETALSAWAMEGFRLPVWAALSTSFMAGFEPPMEVDRIAIYPDGDFAKMAPDGRIAAPPGIAAARGLAARMKTAGIPTVINRPALHGDANDMMGW
jgi:hypothetical protein